jgi:hypothetical protein
MAISPPGDMPKNRVLMVDQGRSMSFYNSLSSEKLTRVFCTANAPARGHGNPQLGSQQAESHDRITHHAMTLFGRFAGE